MRQFKVWENNLEKEPKKQKEEDLVIQKIIYKNLDRME